MDPTNRSEEFGDGAHEPATDGGPARETPGQESGGQGTAPVRVVRLVAGDYVLTVNPVDGSEIEPCLPGQRPGRPGKHGPAERAERLRAAGPPPPARAAGPELPLLERQEERERLVRLLSRGRSVRLTGPSGSGRSALLDAVAADCADLAPDGVVRLSGHHRTTTDLLYELFAAVHDAPLHRPDRAELLALVHEIGAVVVLDDLEFGGSALDELLDATPECAFLLSATPEIAAPSADSHLEEVFLGGLDRTGCLELLEHAVGRPLTDEEADWAADLWFASEGLPLRFVQAGALLRQRDNPPGAEAAAADEFGVVAERPYVAAAETADPEPAAAADRSDVPLPALASATAPAPRLASRLGEAARDTLRFAVALGGEVPHQAHLPALVGDTHADAALGELLAAGLITATGAHYRLAAGVADQLLAEGYGRDSADLAHSAAQHYAWWTGHPSVTPERAAQEADAILAALAAPAADGEAAHAEAAVRLARTAAPAFAAALHWSAWERCLRHGQAAARRTGDVGEEAYFHHELGVLALCTGNIDRARAELEASVGMRGVLADKRGAIAGRRALALVADRSGRTPNGPAAPRTEPGATPAAPVPSAPTPAFPPPVPPAARPTAGEEIPDARREESATPPSAMPAAPFAAPFATPVDQDRVTTEAINRLGAGAGSGGGAGKRLPSQPWARKLMVSGTRRNLAAAGAGALLAAVLGTVVTLGATSRSHDGDASDGKVTPDRSASQQDGDSGLTADRPGPGEAGHAQVPGQPGKPGQSASPGASGSASPGASGSSAPSTGPSGGGKPSGGPSQPSTPSESPSKQPTKDPTTPPAPSKDPTKDPTKGPTSPPVTPSQPPTGGGGSSSVAGAPTGGHSGSSGSRPSDGGAGSPSA
ncbi:ATP-binding protein [Streptomyces olivoreticuli]|uniref:ATP-binding protein n=1 Tax=Streptomyces olivoreticuli TaxID=68246 RepID=UPI00265AD787|nr:ATP-binding protein [Streptomyces olivoreticuli]WKK25850.1 ATP-binding protein [Streptomyces olivoreticuli]